jgi:ribosomal protein S12 methylthiotransferase accessory factor
MLLGQLDRLGELSQLRKHVLHCACLPAPICAVRLDRLQIEPYLEALGITRVGDLTGLDRAGVPVWFACRPASRSLSVSQGKGLTHEQAWMSAVMESAESAIAENPGSLVAMVASQNEMLKRGLRMVDLKRQSRCAARRLSADQPLAWVGGMSWKTGETLFAPYELVGMDMMQDSPWDRNAFRTSSCGLAAGADLCSAVLHGLQELVEDDAMLTSGTMRLAHQKRAAVCFTGTGAAKLEQLISRIESAGLRAGFTDMTSNVGVPVIQATIESAGCGEAEDSCFAGYACRSEMADAGLAALLEAVQSRVTFISGARDDLLPGDYAKSRLPRAKDASLAASFDPGVHAAPAQRSKLENLEHTLKGIFDAGISDVHVFALGGEEYGIRVVRVLADDLATLDLPWGAAQNARVAHSLIRNWGSQ